MAKDGMPNFEIPTQMRQFAEQSVEQAKKAVDGFLEAAHKTVSVIEGQANAAQSGAKTMTEKAMGFAEQNIANSFDFAQRLVGPEPSLQQGRWGGRAEKGGAGGVRPQNACGVARPQPCADRGGGMDREP